MSALHKDRNGCALHGAVSLVDSIHGAVPIVHANAGCSLNARHSSLLFTAATSSNGRFPAETSATTLYDKHIVFGGTSRLREQIKNTVKVLTGDLYVVITGCVPEVVGDDVPAMVKEAREQQFPVLGISTPGFKGNAYQGHALALATLLDGLASNAKLPRDDTLINLLGLVPSQDAFSESDLDELTCVLAGIGLRVNRLTGWDSSVAAWQQAPAAALSIVLSHWGLAAARQLEARHGTPWLDFGWLPVGSQDTGLLLAEIGTALQLDTERIGQARQRLDQKARHHLRKSTGLLASQSCQRRIAIVAGSASGIGLARFLAGTLGRQLAAVILTDDVPAHARAALHAALAGVAPQTVLAFSTSQDDIDAALLAAQADLIFGSELERPLAQRLHAELLEVSAPLAHSLILQRPLAGPTGALALLEAIAERVLTAPDHRQRSERPSSLPHHLARPAAGLPPANQPEHPARQGASS